MAEPMEVTITLNADVVEKLLERPLTKGVGDGERAPLLLDEFVNDAIRRYPESREDYIKQFYFAGAQLGYPGYAHVYAAKYGE